MDAETTETTQTEVEEAPVTTNSNAELEAAQAALAVMPDPDDDEVGKETEAGNVGLKAEADKLLGVITARRATARALKMQEEKQLAKAEPIAAAKETPKSPLEVFVEQNGDDMVPGKVHLAESKFQEALKATKDQANAKVDATKALKTNAVRMLGRGAAMFSDFEEVYQTALDADLISEGNFVDIKKAEQPEVLLYEIAIANILAAGNKPGATAEAKATSKTLATRLRAKKVATESVKKKAPKESDGSEVPESNKAQKSAHLARLESIL